jgi:hypothetical protein
MLRLGLRLGYREKTGRSVNCRDKFPQTMDKDAPEWAMFQEMRRNAIGEQFGRRPDMICQAGRHRCRDRLPTSQRAGASRRFRLPQWLA